MDQKTDVQGVSSGWESLDGLYRVSFGFGGLSSPRTACPRAVHCPARRAGPHLVPDITGHYLRTNGTPLTLPTAPLHPSQVVPGELTIVTGIPNSGKSEWIDALMCNLSENEGWSFACCSLEKKVRVFECAEKWA